MQGSPNITLGCIVLFYYVVQTYIPLVRSRWMPDLLGWHVALGYWFAFGAIFRNLRFIGAAFLSVGALALVMAVLSFPKVTLVTAFAALSVGRARIPVGAILFIVLPALFFGLNFDPFALTRDLPGVMGSRVRAYLLLILSSGEMLKARSRELVENLLCRGLDLRARRSKLRHIHRFLPTLLVATIHEGTYRHSFLSMLGCPPSTFPAYAVTRRISIVQKVVILIALGLVALRLWL